jgi:hypothetical protein
MSEVRVGKLSMTFFNGNTAVVITRSRAFFARDPGDPFYSAKKFGRPHKAGNEE